jgi:hypothetical protein
MASGADPVAVVRLSARERQVLARRHPELGGYEAGIVVLSDAELAAFIGLAMERFGGRLNREIEARFEELIEDYLSREPTMFTRQEAERQAKFRQRVVTEQGGYTAAEVADLNGSRATNRSRLASGWRATDRIFGVGFLNRTIYLAFQFDDTGHPLPVIAEVLRSFSGWPEWEIAGWFVRPNGLLTHAAPVELLRTAPDRVTQAAAADARDGLSPLRHAHHNQARARARRARTTAATAATPTPTTAFARDVPRIRGTSRGNPS